MATTNYRIQLTCKNNRILHFFYENERIISKKACFCGKMAVELDTKDRKILSELDMGARQPS